MIPAYDSRRVAGRRRRNEELLGAVIAIQDEEYRLRRAISDVVVMASSLTKRSLKPMTVSMTEDPVLMSCAFPEYERGTSTEASKVGADTTADDITTRLSAQPLKRAISTLVALKDFEGMPQMSDPATFLPRAERMVVSLFRCSVTEARRNEPDEMTGMGLMAAIEKSSSLRLVRDEESVDRPYWLNSWPTASRMPWTMKSSPK
mmetsp:Transcript_25302/g.43702  ORF Transcript_25302/g.43702 Transcript_25302/m.43702 type:complete len:204 (-) Transcript_25302:396-1007(-)